MKKVTGLEKLTTKPGHLEIGRVPVQYIYEIAKIKKDLDLDLAH